jgi:uncharacterized protein (TIGR03086 family)
MDTVDFGPAAQRLGDLIARVPDDNLGQPTPCPAYTLGDLIEHIGTMALAFAAAAAKNWGPLTSQQPSGDASRLRPDWRTRIPRDLAALAQAWREPGAWTGMTRIASMDAPAEMVGATAADELVVHGWDVAHATGQPYEAEPDMVAVARAFLDAFATPDAPAGPEVAFGPARLLPDSEPPLDRLVAMAGRDPAWSA